MKLEKSSGVTEMSEACAVQGFCFDIALPAKLSGASEKEQIGFVYDKVKKRYGKTAPTWRRIRAFWYGEVEDHNIRARELRQLDETAALLDAAREAHASYIAETERLAAAFLYQDEDFGRPEIEARRSLARRVYSARAGGERQ